MCASGQGPGVLCLVVGPSGAGKDTLLDGARARLGAAYLFPKRVITRGADAGGEDHEAISETCFETLEAEGALALSWRAHDLGYGVRTSAVDELLAGRHLVVNVSRSVLDEARARFPRVHVFSVTVPESQLRQRLRARGRESHEDIEARIARAAAFEVSGDDVTEIRNDAEPDTAVARFVEALQRVTADEG
ncbi:MAG: phosphonate metabolism protein/1,5-bisphosphokinase (PRPP-forming) PhnN [Pseudomonadales bacterium]|jgi:phosphonate metabolism protein PhnN/1,5-bisphosphokinase (PRPP-forming)|nr:phosphonate metabolism protein/1,5-bisphosphokinase (PRPP-forming) PhnN [Pseudomonadales bacterium]